MTSHVKLVAISILAISSVSLLHAQGTPLDISAPATASPHALPYIAEVIGTDVYVRSGPGTTYYNTDKLNTPDRVTVVDHQDGWSKIIPPSGSFSWVAKEYVQISPIMPGVGVIKGDGVRVWAGSDYVLPMRSIQMQVRLNDGDMVRLIDPENQKEDYYKIFSPPGAYLWISSNLLKHIQPLPRPALSIAPEPRRIESAVAPRIDASTAPLQVPPRAIDPTISTVPQRTAIDPVVRPIDPAQLTPAPIEPIRLSAAAIETKRVQECYNVLDKVMAEVAKPILDQNYDEYRNVLTAVQQDADAGKAKQYAEYLLQQIARFEFARTVADDLNKHEIELQKSRQHIRQAQQAKLDEIPDKGKYIIKGTLRPSRVFTGEVGRKRYMIVNEQGKILCYAVAAEGIIGVYVDKFVGRQVGLKGTIFSDQLNPVGLVTFTAIDELPAQTVVETADNR